jgi:hypothetical protein
MYLKISKGHEVLIDDEDYEYLSQFSWSANTKNKDIVYAIRSKRIGKRSEDKKEMIYMHRELVGATKGEYVDHINRNTLDNRKCNLRKCENRQNSRNSIGRISLRKYSIYKGVKKNTNASSSWSARITVDGKAIYLGSYKTENEAAKAYNEACLKYHLDFANLNKIIGD